MNQHTTRKAAAWLCCALMLLSGCGAGAQGTLGAAGETGAAGAASQSGGVSAPAAQSTITCVDPLYSLGEAGKAGFYYLDYAATGDYNIKYIDISTKQDVFLCSRPECVHQDETCTAWLQYGENTAGVVPLEEKLLLVYYGSMVSSSYETYGEQALPSLSAMPLSGGARERIALFLPQDSLTGKYALDASSFYVVTVETIKQDEEIVRSFVLSTVDLQTGEIKKSKQLDGSGLQIEGAVQNKLILSRTYAEQMSSVSDMQWELFSFEPATETEESICVISRADTAFKVAGEKLYTVSYETGALSVMDLRTKSSETLGNIMAEGAGDMVFLKGVVQDGVLFDLQTQGQPDRCFFFSFAEKQAKEITLPLLPNETLDPNRNIEVAAEFDSQYLVVSGITMGTVTFPGPDGANMEMAVPKTQFALIDKDNYQNSIAEYEHIAS